MINELVSLRVMLNGMQISNDITKLNSYVISIDSLSPSEKAADLGRAMFAAFTLQGFKVSAEDFDKANALSAEANNRMYAHVLYLASRHQLDFINDEIQNNIHSYMIDIAIEVISNMDVETINAYEIGIKGVERIASDILD